jgi:large subunit ribosomal protein L16
MLLLPKRTKWRRQHRARLKGSSGANSLRFGDYGLQAVEGGWVTARQIEATRRSIIRYVRRTGKLWIRIFPDRPMTVRPPESRMGSGKGKVEFWVCPVRTGAVLFEITVSGSVPTAIQKKARYILNLASYKLPIKVKFIERR